MSPVWRSHQEHLLADDPVLHRRRESLARVGEAVGGSHELSSYAEWIDFDDYMLYDEEKREMARMNVVHTNAVKHQFDNWRSPFCLNCHGCIPDTQYHRFGAVEPSCADAIELTTMLRPFYAALDKNQLLADQTLLIPVIGHNIAQALGLQCRAV
ncbi:LOW QUALITY PROTEIN: hypothetical protein PHMEG_0008024 [Phytophthora megakarya]|uniref:Uncharacterized protein n=1 Tax=Phytophthora megakarya TaxID=4795 RepID=A0A225WKL9_9STRA|nr:LOW QUALITY PROTEIN: hypothetical protein PHMEG_0008024 [Phytophthora megakarya]